MKKTNFLIFIVLVLVFGQSVYGQNETDVIQFSGMVVTEAENGEVLALPYTNISIAGTSRGTVSNDEGFFSIAARKGEKVLFSRVGFKDATFVIPDTLTKTLYSYIQIMSEDSILLPEAVIFPWPDKDYFKYEFLAIDISDELREKAEENVAKEILEEIRYSIPVDGREATSLVLRESASDFRYVGQTKPQNIFNPLAWKKFIEAWRRGDFKRKKKSHK